MAIALMGIYALTNTVNGKTYVGQSADLAKRWAQHETQLRAGMHRGDLQADWNSFGPEAWTWRILEVVADSSALRPLEAKWIATLRADDSEHGYNAPLAHAITSAPLTALPDLPADTMLVSEAADTLGLTRWGVWRLMSTGQLPYRMLGRFRVVRRADVLALKARRPPIQRRGRPRKQDRPTD